MVSDTEINILMIEDNPDEAELIQDFLSAVRGFSYRMNHFDRLSQGIQFLNSTVSTRERVDVALLDLHLPDSGGYETFNRFRENAPFIPIILLTNLNDEALACKTVREGAQDYLVKTELDGNLLSRSIRYAIERKCSEEKLREIQERYRLAIQGANDGLWDWNLETNRIFFSDRWKEILGYENGEIGEGLDEWFKRVHPDDIERVQISLYNHINDPQNHFEQEHRMRCKEGDYIWVMSRGMAVINDAGIAYRMAGSLTNINMRKQTEEQLLHDAFHDYLTNLPNRALFTNRLSKAIDKMKRYKDFGFAILFLDLDRFKVINDSLGHAVGDRMLVAVSKLLLSCLRSGDSIARFGGDEFVILLERISDPSVALEIAERIRKKLQRSIHISGHNIVTSASVGIVYGEPYYDSPQEILRDADIAMYHAKMRGKSCHIVFSQTMRKNAISRMELENDLRRAILDEGRRHHELDVFFQPIVALDTGMIKGFEALLRWNHPKRGSIKPDEFIPIAEETDLIHPLGLWVLEQACSQLREWQEKIEKSSDRVPLSMNVNISGKQFSRPQVVESIKHILSKYTIDPSTLSLEITESLLVGYNDEFLDVLEDVLKLGVNINVDDFGRGYSSFGYLQRLPVNTLKIDSLFTRWLEEDGKNSEIVKTIVGMAMSMGISVIAEGVETRGQLQKLIELKCPFVQGFFLSRPLNRQAAGDLLAKNRRLVNTCFVGAGIS